MDHSFSWALSHILSAEAERPIKFHCSSWYEVVSVASRPCHSYSLFCLILPACFICADVYGDLDVEMVCG